MDDAIRKALKKRKELVLELERLEHFISVYEEISGSEIPRDELTLSGDIGENPQNKNNSGTIDTPKKRRNNVKKLLDHCERIIDEAGRPLNRSEIAEILERVGVTVYASDIPKYLGTLLWRNQDRFVSSDGDGYYTHKLKRDEIPF